jgi:amino acid permease
MPVYLVVIGWLYVVLMMSVAEATNTTGTVLGAVITFALYGVLPIVLVIYIMRTPQRRKERKAIEAAEDQARRETAAQPAQPVQAASGEPDAGSHTPAAAEPGSVPPVGKEV